jgi:ATP-dependent metalloprotease FtsH
MYRLISRPTGLLCQIQGRQLSTSTLCQRRRWGRPKNPASPPPEENPTKRDYNDDHLADFEKQRKVQKVQQKDRQAARQKIEDRRKAEENLLKAKAQRYAKLFVYIIFAIMIHGVYKATWLAYSRYTQEEFEKLDRISVHRLFEQYLSNGLVADMQLRFVGDEEKEIVVTLVDGRQFITNCNWRNFHSVLTEFEEDLNIHPKERRAGKDFEILTLGATVIKNYTDYKAQLEGQLINLTIEFILLASMIMVGGGPRRYSKNTSNTILKFLKQLEAEGAKKSTKIVPVPKTNVTLSQVAGMKEEKREIEEFVEFLKYPDKFEDLGAKMPKGVLLSGPPGTGKTMLAKAVANDCNVNFYYKGASEFVKSTVGTGAKDVRAIFEEARKNQPCIIFFDELDAIGKKRADEAGGGGQESDNTLNQLLVEMDGMNNRNDDVIIVMAATNAPESLDDALVRPGRFDRKIHCGLPATDGRFEIFMVYLRTVKTEKPPIEYAQELADLTPGMSGAQIANIINEAALLTARSKSDLVKLEHFIQAIDRVTTGSKRRSTAGKLHHKQLLAAMEAGKCLTSWLLPTQDPVLKSSIVPRTHSNVGYTQFSRRDRFLKSEEYMRDKIVVLLAGRIAQKVLFGKVSTQVENDEDSKQATAIATEMVKLYGMSEKLGQVNLSSDIQVSDNTKRLIDMERARVVNEAIKIAEDILTKHETELRNIVDFLVRKEVIHTDELKEIIGTDKKVDDPPEDSS